MSHHVVDSPHIPLTITGTDCPTNKTRWTMTSRATRRHYETVIRNKKADTDGLSQSRQGEGLTNRRVGPWPKHARSSSRVDNCGSRLPSLDPELHFFRHRRRAEQCTVGRIGTALVAHFLGRHWNRFSAPDGEKMIAGWNG